MSSNERDAEVEGLPECDCGHETKWHTEPNEEEGVGGCFFEVAPNVYCQCHREFLAAETGEPVQQGDGPGLPPEDRAEWDCPKCGKHRTVTPEAMARMYFAIKDDGCRCWEHLATEAAREEAVRAVLTTYGAMREERDDYRQAWKRDVAKGREIEAERDALRRDLTAERAAHAETRERLWGFYNTARRDLTDTRRKLEEARAYADDNYSNWQFMSDWSEALADALRDIAKANCERTTAIAREVLAKYDAEMEELRNARLTATPAAGAPVAGEAKGGCMIDRSVCPTPDLCESEKRCEKLAPVADPKGTTP